MYYDTREEAEEAAKEENSGRSDLVVVYVKGIYSGTYSYYLIPDTS